MLAGVCSSVSLTPCTACQEQLALGTEKAADSVKVTDLPVSHFDQTWSLCQPPSWKTVGSTAQYTYIFTELQQQRWALLWENRSIAVTKFCTCPQQTLEPCGAQEPKQVVQISEQERETVRQTVISAAGTAAHHTGNKNRFSMQMQPLPDLKICYKAV